MATAVSAAPRDEAREDVADDPAASTTFFPSPEAMEEEITTVLAIKLSNEMQPWVEGYAQVGHRNPFLWNWCRRGVEVTMLSCVEAPLRDAVCDTRVLGIMLDVLLDDIADHQKDLAFLEQLLGVLESGARPAEDAFALHQRAYAALHDRRLGRDRSVESGGFRGTRSSRSCSGSTTGNSST